MCLKDLMRLSSRRHEPVWREPSATHTKAASAASSAAHATQYDTRVHDACDAHGFGGGLAQETGGAVDNVKETNRLSAANKSSSLVSSVAWTTGDPAELDSNYDAPQLQTKQLLDLPTPNVTRPVRTLPLSNSACLGWEGEGWRLEALART